MNVPARFRNALLAVGLAAAVGCSSDDPKSPTAPPTTPVPPVTPVTYAVTVSPSKSVLTVATNDFANVTVTATRTDNGAAPPNLTKVTLTTTLGSFGNASGPQTLEAELISGQAVVAFFPGATVGTATLRAQVGDSVGFGSVRVAEEDNPTFYLSSVSPNTGSPQGGETVDILGGGFDPPIRVTFDGNAATVLSSTGSRITVRTPPCPSTTPGQPCVPAGGSKSVSVSVTINYNEEGTATDSLTGGFTYVNGGGGGILQPTIFSLTPSSGPNEGGTEVVINGDGFEAPVQVKFGAGTADASFDGAEATVLSVSRTRIVVRSPATSCALSSCARPQPNDLSNVLVKNLNSGRYTVATSAFKYGSVIIVTSMGPTQGSIYGGTRVTIYGQGFDEPVAVGFGGIAQQVLSVSGTELVVLTTHPASCVSGPQTVSVTNIETGATSPSTNLGFIYLKPNVFSISPTSGPQGGNTLVTVSGENFGSPILVTFNAGSAYQATVQSVTSNSIQVRTPAIPDSAFTSVPCDADGDGTSGQVYQPRTATITVTDPVSGCTDTFEGVFTYNPSNTSCRGD